MNNSERIAKKMREITRLLDKDGLSMFSCTTVSHWKIKFQRLNQKGLTK